jgi:hypothetical protein
MDSHIEALADIACDLDFLANQFRGPDRTLIKQYASVLHDIAFRLADADGLSIYMDDPEVQ